MKRRCAARRKPNSVAKERQPGVDALAWLEQNSRALFRKLSKRLAQSLDPTEEDMTLKELVELGQAALEAGADPALLVVAYADGRPEQYGDRTPHPAILRTITSFGPLGVVSAGNRSHWIRHADAASQEVIALG